MPVYAGRPVGIVLIAVFIAANGLVSLGEALELVQSGAGEVLMPVALALTGLLLLHRAYGLWNLQRRYWLVTILILSLRAGLAALSLLASTQDALAWVGLGLSVLAILFLLRPSIRASFQ